MANSTTLYTIGDGRTAVDVTLNKTLAASDSGVVQNVIADGITITLPATVVGMVAIVRNGGVTPTGAAAGATSDGTVLVTVAPNASDQIAGAQITAADNKALLNTKATSRVGDEVRLIADGTAGVGWNVESLKGIWARAA